MRDTGEGSRLRSWSWRYRGSAALAGVSLAASAVALGTVPAQAAGPGLGEYDTYVALGDSAASGPFIPEQDPTSPGCYRSDHNYPRLLASRLGAGLVDVTCTGARTKHLVDTPQETPTETVKPQIESVTPDTDLVTITIGANDIDMVKAVASCVNVFPAPHGTSCKDELVPAGGTDKLRRRIDAAAPRWGEMLDLVRERAPQAKVLVVGYGTYLKPGGCHPYQPFWAKDADYISGTLGYLDDRLRVEAEAHGATFVDLRPMSEGHDACAEPEQRYVAGVIPSEPAAPLHPTGRGMNASAEAIHNVLRGAPAV